MGLIWHTEQRSHILRVRTCPFATFSFFGLYLLQTQEMSVILTSSKVSQKEVPFSGGKTSHVAVTKFLNTKFLYSVKSNTLHLASVIAHNPLTLVEPSQQKLLKITNY